MLMSVNTHDDDVTLKSHLLFVFDNATIHKTPIIKQWFKAQGVTALTLPQYTPEWNPIEKAYSLAKNMVSK